MINNYPFTSVDQDAEFNLVITHNLDTTNILPSWTDENGVYQLFQGLCHFGDALGSDQNNKITFMIGSPVTGTNKILLQYLSANETLATKKPLEQYLTTIEPELDDRFILGKAGKSVYNITWAYLKQLLTTAIGGNFFAVTDTPFSEILFNEDRKKAGRNNLGVYSKTNVDTFFLSVSQRKGAGQMLGINNTESYTPETEYNPATKRYADSIPVKGTITLNDTGHDSNIINLTLISAYTYKFGVTVNDRMLFNLSFRFYATSASVSTFQFVGYIEGLNIASLRQFVALSSSPNVQETAYVELRPATGGQTAGNAYIYAKCGQSSSIWICNALISY